MKHYPPRPKIIRAYEGKPICECGHANFEHECRSVGLSNPPTPFYDECGECMCPQYKHDHTEEFVKLS